MSQRQKISLVIPCKDDPLVLQCVHSSLDADEIVIVFNGSTEAFMKDVAKELSKVKTPISYYGLEHPNLSWALESGSRIAAHDNILYMDSDCTFAPDTIASFRRCLETTDMSRNVLKGEIVFDVGTTFVEKIIAKSRTHHTSEVLTAYKPPLLVSKSILPKIGGYFFNSRLIWREDSDLDNRIRQAHINILPVAQGIIHHKKITLKTDLRSTFRYGIGLALANTMNITLTEVPRSVMSTYKSQGFLPALYMIFRNRVYDAGYWYAHVVVRYFHKPFGNQASADGSERV